MGGWSRWESGGFVPGSRRLSAAIPTGKVGGAAIPTGRRATGKVGGAAIPTGRREGEIKKGRRRPPFLFGCGLELAVENLFGLDCAVGVNSADDVDTGCGFGKTYTVEVVDLYADHFG